MRSSRDRCTYTEEQPVKWILIILVIVAIVFLAQKFMAGRR